MEQPWLAFVCRECCRKKYKWFKALRTIENLPSGQCFSKSDMTENFGKGRNDIHREF